MILLIISCTKSCGLVAISPCHFHLHLMLLMPSLITLDHITLATLVSLNFQNQTWAFRGVVRPCPTFIMVGAVGALIGAHPLPEADLASTGSGEAIPFTRGQVRRTLRL
jgi:hypothetical protein